MMEVGGRTNMVMEGEFRSGCIWFECDPICGVDSVEGQRSSSYFEHFKLVRRKERSFKTLNKRARSGDVEGKTRRQ